MKKVFFLQHGAVLVQNQWTCVGTKEPARERVVNYASGHLDIISIKFTPNIFWCNDRYIYIHKIICGWIVGKSTLNKTYFERNWNTYLPSLLSSFKLGCLSNDTLFASEMPSERNATNCFYIPSLKCSLGKFLILNDVIFGLCLRHDQ